jgi:hypothetical protein
VILYFLGIISNSRKNLIENEIIVIFDKYSDNPVLQKIITEKIGYIKK